MMGQAHIPKWVKAAFNRSSGNVLAQWLSGNSVLASLLAKDRRLSRAAHWLSLRVSWSKCAEGRGKRALEILADEDNISKVSPHHFTVRSQSDPSKIYNVRYKGCQWSCDCPDHHYRKAQCKHILAAMSWMMERETAILNGSHKERKTVVDDTPKVVDTPEEQPDIEIHPVSKCPKKCIRCQSRIIKWGFADLNTKKSQRYRCKNPECEATFVYKGGFERMRKPKWAILRTFNDFYKGHSPNDISDSLVKEEEECQVHPSNIYRWQKKFIIPMDKYLRTLPIKIGERFTADEIILHDYDADKESTNNTKQKGNAKKSKTSSANAESNKPDNKLCLFTVHDIKTRFCLAHDIGKHKNGYNATKLLESAKKRAGKVPSEFVSDGLPSYNEAHNKVFAAKTPLDKYSVHQSDASINNKKHNNNFQERANGTFRTFQRPRRGITNAESPLIKGFFVYYNFIRPHSSLGKRTPAEAAGVIIHGRNKWETIIGNAWLAKAAANI